jgi:hypothetical protein
MEVTLGLVALGVSIVATLIALLAPYYEHLRRGRLRMFSPRDIYFLPHPGVGFRVLMWSTARRGHRVREMLVRVRRDGEQAEFAAWRYRGELAGGVFVPFEGLEENHTFFFPHDGSKWEWRTGTHTLEVLAKIDEGEEELVLSTVTLNLPEDLAATYRHPRAQGVWFEWSRGKQDYICFANPPADDDESEKQRSRKGGTVSVNQDES